MQITLGKPSVSLFGHPDYTGSVPNVFYLPEMSSQVAFDVFIFAEWD